MSEAPPIAPVYLAGVEFNWPDAKGRPKGLPLQKRSAEWVPEYRSEVAYALGEVGEAIDAGKLMIKACFRSNLGDSMVLVRARDVAVDVRDVFSGKIVKRLPGNRALGDVAPTTVYFNEEGASVYRGKYRYVPMALENPALRELGLGIYDVNLSWEFRRLNQKRSEEEGKAVWKGPWLPFGMSKHRVYVTLDRPRLPWKASLESAEGVEGAWYPWGEALDIACSWAKGAKDVAEAAQLIADRLWESGRFDYDTSPWYCQTERMLSAEGERFAGVLRFEKVVERIKRGQGLGAKVNCQDCAAMLVAFVNLLGGDLRMGRLQNSAVCDDRLPDLYEQNRFEVRRILGIGDGDAEVTMRGIEKVDGYFFSYHSVAWMGAGPDGSGDLDDPDTLVFDASLRFMVGDEAVSAAGLRMDRFRVCLAAEGEMGLPRCLPQRATVWPLLLR